MVCLYNGLSNPDAPAPWTGPCTLASLSWRSPPRKCPCASSRTRWRTSRWSGQRSWSASRPTPTCSRTWALSCSSSTSARRASARSRPGQGPSRYDPPSVDPAQQPYCYCLTHACILRMVCTFLMLYCHMHLLSVAHPAPEEYLDVGLTKYHIEA